MAVTLGQETALLGVSHGLIGALPESHQVNSSSQTGYAAVLIAFVAGIALGLIGKESSNGLVQSVHAGKVDSVAPNLVTKVANACFDPVQAEGRALLQVRGAAGVVPDGSHQPLSEPSQPTTKQNEKGYLAHPLALKATAGVIWIDTVRERTTARDRETISVYPPGPEELMELIDVTVPNVCLEVVNRAEVEVVGLLVGEAEVDVGHSCEICRLKVRELRDKHVYG